MHRIEDVERAFDGFIMSLRSKRLLTKKRMVYMLNMRYFGKRILEGELSFAFIVR